MDLAGTFDGFSSADVSRSINRGRLDMMNFAALLSGAAALHIEDMAGKAHEITLRHFGRAMQLYTPIYLSDHCDNQCAYCGFSAKNNLERRTLSMDDIGREAGFIASKGFKHILILTGESRKEAPVAYIKEGVKLLRKYFDSISIEIYALSQSEYSGLAAEGADGLTIYQEVYDESIYSAMHPSGPKRDYIFRLGAPERGASSGMRSVNIGALLGLNDWRKEIFILGMHAKYLQDRYPDVEIGVSVPRLRPITKDYHNPFEVSDRDMVQIIVSLRIFLPRLGISLSTREGRALRENLIPLGITRMSAESTTRVGGHTINAGNNNASPQFEIKDHSGLEEVIQMLERKGYQAVLKDWVQIF